MPKIVEYVNPIEGVRPTETGVEAFAAAGRRAGAFYNQVADTKGTVGATMGRNLDSAINDAGRVAVDFASHQEISHGAAAYAGLNDKLTQEWNKRAQAADPNDPTIATKFREEVLAPELEKFGQSFLTDKGRDWAQSRAAASTNHFFEKTTADMMQKASDAAIVNAKQLENHLTNTALQDPSSVQHLLETAESSVSAVVSSNPNIKGVTASKLQSQLLEKMRESIVRSGAIGAIQSSRDPEATAAEWGRRYPDYINGAELKQFGQMAKQVQRLDRAQANMNRVEQDRQAKTSFNTAANQLEADTIGDNGERMIPPDYAARVKALSRHPGAAQEPGRVKTMIDNLDTLRERMAKGIPAITDPHVLETLNSSLAVGPGDPNFLSPAQLSQMNAKGQLSDHDYSKYMKYLEASEKDPARRLVDRDFKTFLDAMKPSITTDSVLNTKGDPVGMQRYGQFSLHARQILDDIYAKQGIEGVRKALDENSPTYLGKLLPHYVEDSKTSYQQLQQRKKSPLVPPANVPGTLDQQLRSPARPEPRRQGESAADYLARTRGK